MHKRVLKWVNLKDKQCVLVIEMQINFSIRFKFNINYVPKIGDLMKLNLFSL